MKSIIGMIAALFLSLTGAVMAQEQGVWVQIEAQPNLNRAEARAEAYSNVLPNVAGFTTDTGWYAVALGPYNEAEARRVIGTLQASGSIPTDAFLVDGRGFRQQFWPRDTLPSFSDTAPVIEVVPLPAPGTSNTTQPVREETRAEARESERALSSEARKEIQRALEWEGYYRSGIDGAFGPGTRRAMADYQAFLGADPTGILTSRQRAGLLQGYREILESLGMERLVNREAGIEIMAPMGLVSFDRYDPPFVVYKGENGAQLLLISQEGTEATLAGLYDIMQTLEIVPLNGERRRETDNFLLTGRNAEIVSYTYAEARNGQVKGFTLVWPTGDDRRRERVIQELRASFTPIEGVLDDTLGAPEGEQRIDLLAGLEIRRPERSRSGFFVDGSGTVLTSADIVGSCTRVTIDEETEADVVAQSSALGLAVLRPKASLAPIRYAAFRPGVPRLQSEVAVAGYSYEGALGAPTLTFGRLADLRGLSGETTQQRLDLEALPGDAGGPVFDLSGSVLGVLIAPDTGSRQLPEGVEFAASIEAVTEILAGLEISPVASEPANAMAPEDLVQVASDMTVLVSCWN